jgi:CheY-like chemotaxis protein
MRTDAPQAPLVKDMEQAGLARVLLADDDPASRLTLQTVLEAGGYSVDSAASAAEAVGLLEQTEYALVLSDLSMESPQAGLKVLEHARMQPYRPATALVTAYHTETGRANGEEEMLIAPEDIPELLSKVAGLIGNRATRRAARSFRQG